MIIITRRKILKITFETYWFFIDYFASFYFFSKKKKNNLVIFVHTEIIVDNEFSPRKKEGQRTELFKKWNFFNENILYFCRKNPKMNKTSNCENKREKNKEKKYEMLIINHDEDNNTFQFYQLPVCDDIVPFNNYAYVSMTLSCYLVDGMIDRLFQNQYKYSIQGKMDDISKHFTQFIIRLFCNTE
ncbi:hypothetical protein RFI_17889 [Reticulomyxa filosa]|uniref:Uncharacterized protein n=1 Tax=Reticulomyxa filosa TaxID=46433 RepID=X6MZV9_RETFI|nr:hypothetical protein RFI_17889 [Reticulomyxa filosa]|eukprot:ETO19341.1 hypothetical protein RFI_17889 [Reticulomyxa filosa]